MLAIESSPIAIAESTVVDSPLAPFVEILVVEPVELVAFEVAVVGKNYVDYCSPHTTADGIGSVPLMGSRWSIVA